MDDDPVFRPVAPAVQLVHLRRREGLSVQRCHGAQTPGAAFVRAGDRDGVYLVHLMAGMQQPLGQRPVVGEQQQPLGVPVQPPHGIDPHAAVLYQLRRRAPSPLVRQGGDVAPGLIEHDVHMTGGTADGSSVHRHGVRLRVSLVADVCRPSVDCDPSCGDPLLRRPPGAQPRRGQQLLYALGHAVTSFPHSPPPAAGGRAAHFPRR